jgi:hypothetical protein
MLKTTLRFLAKHLAYQAIALAGAIDLVLLINSYPDMAILALALMFVVMLTALIRRFIRVVKDPVGSVRWPSND